MSEESYNEGDLVEAVKGETVVRGRVQLSPHYQTPMLSLPTLSPAGTPYLDRYADAGWTITVIEKAKPPVVLPTEPGTVIQFCGSFGVWQLYKSGEWQNTTTGHKVGVTAESLVEAYGSDFEVFAPVAEVLQRLRDDRSCDAFAAVAAHYGVTS